MRYTILLSLLVMTSSLLSAKNSERKMITSREDSLKSLVRAMTIEEKVNLVFGRGFPEFSIQQAAGSTFPIARLGIPSAVLSDGPAGLRIAPKRNGTSATFYCTAFPTGTALSSTWNTDLISLAGKTIGNEVLEYGCDALLAPGMNIQRNPLCGRNFEYYSEDPLLSGKMSASMVNGLQSNGVGATIKHFVANNQETGRTQLNDVISERALREIYLRGFEIAVKESQPWLVMSSYNKVNGPYTSENYDLLTTLLRGEWGFNGMVVSDWGGAADAVKQMQAGNDLLMQEDQQKKKLLNAVKKGILDEKVLDRNVTHILGFVGKTPHFRKYPYSDQPDLQTHASVAREIASEAMILLKNDKGTLPLSSDQKVALWGKNSYRYIVGGTGSGEVNYKHAVSLEEGMFNSGFKVNEPLKAIYHQKIDSLVQNNEKNVLKLADFMSDPALAKEKVIDFLPEIVLDRTVITEQSRNSDVAVITIGRNAGEGRDRKKSDFDLSDQEKYLLKNVSEVYHQEGKKVIVVLNIGGVIETASWRDYADAILLSWQSGQEGGSAIADLLKGNVTPSGKLPMTFPVSYGDVPSSKTFLVEDSHYPTDVFYKEGIYVGYRYYDTFGIEPAYEFGYGLSYTNFEYSDLKLSSPTFSDPVSVEVTIKNTGSIKGKEVVELYLQAPKSNLDKPVQELKGFAKTRVLAPGESQRVSFILDARLLASFDSNKTSWVADAGEYVVKIGSSSRDLRVNGSFSLPQSIVVEKTQPILRPNETIIDLKSNYKE